MRGKIPRITPPLRLKSQPGDPQASYWTIFQLPSGWRHAVP
jgi:hypothetical protein